MIIGVRVNNFRVYAGPVELSLKADMRIKKFITNVHSEKKYNVLKSACIYGGNNVGKTCMVNAITSIRNVLLGLPADVSTNLFSENKVCALGVTFLYEGTIYSYDFHFDNTELSGNPRAFTYERFAIHTVDKHGNESEKVVFIRDLEHNEFVFTNHSKLQALLEAVSPSNILIYTLNSEKYPEVLECKNILRGFASLVDIVDMNNIPLEKTVGMLKEGAADKDKIIELIKKSDLEIDDFEYSSDLDPHVNIAINGDAMPNEIVLRKTQLEDILKLQSVHKGVPLPSIVFDSTGTKKMVALASYITEAVAKGRILVVDELDSSLHFKLTRAIVSLFNNSLNDRGQLICTVHDITLLDCKKLMRKDQIWFANKTEDGCSLKSLAAFTSLKDSVRSDTDIMSKYELGLFGDLPEPDFVSAMLEEGVNEE